MINLRGQLMTSFKETVVVNIESRSKYLDSMEPDSSNGKIQ
jgi:hypothetical protein